MKKLLILAILGVATLSFAAQQKDKPQKAKEQKADPATCPLHEQHMKEKKGAQAGHEHNFEEMNKRGEDARGMGFSQSATVHHFLLGKDGGVIQVEVQDAQDRETRSIVRAHLQDIAASFSKGDFSIAQFVHNKEPDGVRDMQRQKEKIQYRFEETAGGGRVVISATEKKALRAIQDFLRFQITEHKTGDSLSVPQ